MELRAVGWVDESRRLALEGAVRSLRTLEHVVRWLVAQGLALPHVVTQDEYTHDVVVVGPDGLVLVFDCT